MNKKLDEKRKAGAGRKRRPAKPQGIETKPWFRIFAFHGGGLDAVMQLGIAHALLFVEGRKTGAARMTLAAPAFRKYAAGARSPVAPVRMRQSWSATCVFPMISRTGPELVRCRKRWI